MRKEVTFIHKLELTCDSFMLKLKLIYLVEAK